MLLLNINASRLIFNAPRVGPVNSIAFSSDSTLLVGLTTVQGAGAGLCRAEGYKLPVALIHD